MTDTGYIRVESQDRNLNISNSRSDFIVDLKETFKTQAIKAVQVHSAWVPNVFYNISDTLGNRTITIEQKGQAAQDITIAEGQYTVSQFMAAWKVSFDAALAGGSTVAITQDSITQKLQLVFSGGGSPETALNYDTTAAEGGACALGFTGAVAESLTWTANVIPNLRGYSAVYVHSREIMDGNYIDGDSGAISAFVNVSFHDVPFGGMGYYQSGDAVIDTVRYTVPKNLSRLHLVLRDSSGNKLDTGCSNMTVVFKVFF